MRDMKDWQVFCAALGVLSACGDSNESNEERICGAANGCGALISANVNACVAALEMVDADRALSECADCLEAKTCAEIAAGACAPNCGQFSSVFNTGPNVGLADSLKLRDLAPSDSTMLCHELADTDPQRSVQCTINGSNVTVISGTNRADCATASASSACNATVGQARACATASAAISDTRLCDLNRPAQCDVLDGCSFP